MIPQFPQIVGVVNTTPDSFSDGSKFLKVNDAVHHALRLIDQGADCIEIGGESTRPGATDVDELDELQRTIPVIERVRKLNSHIPISIDTRKSTVAARAVDVGATIVNDVSAGLHDRHMFDVVASVQVPLVLMHMQGQPSNMQVNPTYNNVVDDVRNFLNDRIMAARRNGILHVIADVGIGFGKSYEHNITLLRNLKEFHQLQVPLMVGISRKKFLGQLLGIETPEDRDVATALAHSCLLSAHLHYLRVHNVHLLAQLRVMYTTLGSVS